MLNKRLLTNISLFTSGWLICLFFSNSDVTVLFTLLIISTHLTFIGSWKQEKEILLTTLLLGCAIDSFMGNLNILEYSSSNRLLPLWMGCVWLLVGTTINHALARFKSRAWLVLTGFLFAPVHYYLAALRPDLNLAIPIVQTLIILAVIWAILLLLLREFSTVWQKRYKRNKL